MITTKEACENWIVVGKAKANKRTMEILILGIMAGVFTAFSGSVTNLAMHAIENPGIQRLICGSFFPIGLCMVIFSGSELFLGNCLMGIALYDKKIRLRAMLRNWCLTYLGNLIGACAVALGVIIAGQLNLNQGKLAVFTVKVATNKSTMPFSAAFVSGVLCNLLACTAVFMASQAKSAAGKVLCAFLPILYFVTGAFENVVANMYYLAAGLFAAHTPAYAELLQNPGFDASRLTLGAAVSHNLIPATLGNAVGGLFLAFVYWVIYVRPQSVAAQAGIKKAA